MIPRLKAGATAVFILCFSAVYTNRATAQSSGPTAGRDAGQIQINNSPGSTVNLATRRQLPFGFNIHVDAMAIVADWRARQPNSQSGTRARSGVSINGTNVGAGLSNRVVLFACDGGAFLDLAFGQSQTDGSTNYDDGPSRGCEPRQALMLINDRLSCQWYTPPSGRSWGWQDGPWSEIVISTTPPLSIVGECITEQAHVVPAIVWPEGAPGGAGGHDGGNLGASAQSDPNCRSSGVTINGRATGHSARCRN